MCSRRSAVSPVLWVYGDHMLRPRARVGRVLVLRRRRGLLSGVLLLSVLLATTGCGSEDAEKSEGPSKAATSCREQWKDLESEVEGLGARTNPSALPSRWNTIAATIDYYATSAQSSDCGKTLESQEKAMDDLSAFGTRLAPYDMELRLGDAQADAEKYAAGPVPANPSPSPTKKGKKQPKRTPPPPSPADIALALKTLTAQAPVATRQQLAGWQQAAVTDLADTTAVAKSVKDLAFLSSESAAYRACMLALAQIRKALEPVTTR